MAEVKMYGADWCSDCRRSEKLLNNLGVEYQKMDVEQSKELAAEAEAIAGRKNIPVIQFEDGVVLVEPSDAELWAELKLRGLAE
jgi:glutaredoxin